MLRATQFVQPMKFTGDYVDGYWAGYRFKEALAGGGRHTGVDYNKGAGSEDRGLSVVSIAAGRIVYRGDLTAKGFGNTVIVEHVLPDVWARELGVSKLYSRYMHLENLSFANPREVGAGEKIGTCGKTGTAAYHTHLDLWKENLGPHLEYHKNTQLQSYLDPYLFIASHAQAPTPPKPPTNPPQGDDEMIENEQQAKDAYYMLRGDRPVTDGEIKGTAGKRTWAQFAVTGKPEVKVREADYADAVAQRARIPALERQLAEKPKEVEVIKEVVKEVPVEKRVEVPVDKPETLRRIEELQATIKELEARPPTESVWQVIGAAIRQLFASKSNKDEEKK